MHPLSDLAIYELLKDFESEPNEQTTWEIILEFYGSCEEDDLWLAVTSVMQADNKELDADQRRAALWLFENFKALNRALYYLLKQRFHTYKSTALLLSTSITVNEIASSFLEYSKRILQQKYNGRLIIKNGHNFFLGFS